MAQSVHRLVPNGEGKKKRWTKLSLMAQEAKTQKAQTQRQA